MKKIILSIALFAGISASAQYQITSANVPVINDLTYDAVDTIPNANIDGGIASSEAQLFLIADVDLDIEESTLFDDPINYPTSSEFPTADIAFEFGAGPSFAEVKNDRVEVIGTEFASPTGGAPEAIHWDNTLSILRFPYGFGDTYKDTGHFRQSFYIGQDFGGMTIDSGRIDLTVQVTSLVDAFGSLETLNGTFSDVIRERQEITTTNIIEVCIQLIPGFPCQWQDASQFTGQSSEPETEVDYLYYGAQSKFPYASLTYNATEDTLKTVTVSLDEIYPNSINEIKNLGNMVYPNPATEVISVKASEAAIVTISDISGRTILTTTDKNNISIAHLNAGSYVISITENNAVYSGQLIKN